MFPQVGRFAQPANGRDRRRRPPLLAGSGLFLRRRLHGTKRWVMPDSPPLSGDLPGPELEAMFEAMFLAAFADDDFSDEERSRFAERVRELSDGHVQGERFEQLLTGVTRELFTHGLEQRLGTLESRIPDAARRKLTLEVAAEVAACDHLSRNERSLLDRLGGALGLDRDSVRVIVDRALRAAR